VRGMWLLALKDLRLALRDRAGLFFMAGLPIAMGLFFGAINGGLGKREMRLSLAIVDEDRSERSAEFVERIRAGNQAIDLVETDRPTALAQVRRGARAGAILIPDGFGDSQALFGGGAPPVVETAVDPSRAAEAGMLQGVLLQAAGETTFGAFADPDRLRPLLDRSRRSLRESEGLSMPTRLALEAMYGSLGVVADRLEADRAAEEGTATESTDQAGPQFRLLDIRPLPLTRPSSTADRLRSGWDLSIPAASLWAVLGCTATFAVSLVRERTRGTLVRLQVAPLGGRELLGGKALACWIMAVAVMGLLLTIGIGLGMRPKDPLQLAVAVGATAFGFVGVMMAMSTIGRTEEAVGGAGWGANVLMAMFGGGMVPLAFLPGWMQTASHLSPVKWGVLALEGAVWREFTWAEALVPWSVLLGIGAVGFLIGVIRLGRLQRSTS